MEVVIEDSYIKFLMDEIKFCKWSMELNLDFPYLYKMREERLEWCYKELGKSIANVLESKQ